MGCNLSAPVRTSGQDPSPTGRSSLLRSPSPHGGVAAPGAAILETSGMAVPKPHLGRSAVPGGGSSGTMASIEQPKLLASFIKLHMLGFR